MSSSSGKINTQIACLICGIIPERIMRCSKCKIVPYCSKECQLVDWNIGHRNECVSDWICTFSGSINDDWNSTSEFKYSRPLTRQETSDINSNDITVSNKRLESIQQSMYSDNKDNINQLCKWRCSKNPPDSILNRPQCNGIQAIGCVMHSAAINVIINPMKKELTIKVADNGIFPLCTQCIRNNFNNESLAVTGKGGGIDLQHLDYNESGE